MKIYKTLYTFEVLEAMEKDEIVRVLDKQKEKVYNADELPSKKLVKALNSKEKNRFEFWKIEESENEDE